MSRRSYHHKAIVYYPSVFTLLLLLFCQCQNKHTFTINGKIEGAADTLLLLYQRNIVGVQLVDSVRTDDKGSFSISAPSPSYPELYILALGKQMINLAVDSTETISIYAPQERFAKEYTVEGSPQSDAIRKLYLLQHKVEAKLSDLQQQLRNQKISADTYEQQASLWVDSLRNASQNTILNNLKELSAYYALFQQIDGQSLFDALNRKDSKLFSAVATAWDSNIPDAPRAQHLKKFTLQALGQRRQLERKIPTIEQKLLESEQKNPFDISLPGIDNTPIQLSSLQGKVVLLNFTMYQLPETPALNIELNKIYQQYKKMGFEIYQVSFGTPLQEWRTSADNLPWICVREDNVPSKLFSRFNIQGLPTSFLIDRKGEIQQRITTIEQLERELKKAIQQ